MIKDGLKMIMRNLSIQKWKMQNQYGATMLELERILKVFYAHKPQELIEKEKDFNPTERFAQNDIILITYGDLLRRKQSSSLATLARFCDTYLNGTIHPNGDQQILLISPDVFAVLRTSPEKDQHILTVTNVTSQECSIEIPLSEIDSSESQWCDLLGKKRLSAEKRKLCIILQPYDVIWLQPLNEIK